MEENIKLEMGQEDFKGLEPLKDAPLAPAHGIAAIALNFALKYHDISTVQDGTLYQRYKLEGRNMRELHLDMVFDTAIKMEAYLSSDRIAKIVVDALAIGIADDESGQVSLDEESLLPVPPVKGK